MLIVDIGNNNKGCFDTARIMIEIALLCGADLVKGQAIVAEEVTTGSMPKDFYEQCSFTEDEYIRLIKTFPGKVFFTVFSPSLSGIYAHQNYHKVAGGQYKKGLEFPDSDRDWETVKNTLPGNVFINRIY